MAKKSAKSKGYRKGSGKKPYLTKRDIIILCVIVAALIVGAILLFSYDDGALKVNNGSVVDLGDNWVVVNGAASGGHRYYKLAELGDIEGYTRGSLPSNDANIAVFTYTPDDEASPVDSITVSGSANTAEFYADNLARAGEVEVKKASAGDVAYSYYINDSAFYSEPVEASDEAAEAATDEAEAPADETEAAADTAEAPAEETEAPTDDAEAATDDAEAPAEEAEAPADETEAATDDAEAPAEEAEAATDATDDAEVTGAEEEHAPNHYVRQMHAFVSAPHDGSLYCIVTTDVPTEDAQLSEEELQAILGQVIAAAEIPAK